MDASGRMRSGRRGVATVENRILTTIRGYSRRKNEEENSKTIPSTTTYICTCTMSCVHTYSTHSIHTKSVYVDKIVCVSLLFYNIEAYIHVDLGSHAMCCFNCACLRTILIRIIKFNHRYYSVRKSI